MPVEFRYATREEYPRISRFLNDYWAQDHVYCRDRALFEWTFHRPGHWPEDEYSFALAEDGGRAGGHPGRHPVRVQPLRRAFRAESGWRIT